jgi:uncharacterized protein
MSVVAALGGAFVFQRLGVPAGALVGAMVAVAVLNLTGGNASSLPSSVEFVTFALIGWSVGAQFSTESLAALQKAAWPIAASILILVVLGGAIAWILWQIADLDPITAFLAACPGGLAQMVAVSSDVGANSVVVAAVHLVRLAAVLLVAPLIVKTLPPG